MAKLNLSFISAYGQALTFKSPVIDVLRKSAGWVPRNLALGDDICFESIELTLSLTEICLRVKNEDMSEFSAAEQYLLSLEHQSIRSTLMLD